MIIRKKNLFNYFLVLKGFGQHYSEKLGTLFGFSKKSNISFDINQSFFINDYHNELSLLNLKQKEHFDMFLSSYKEKVEALKNASHYKGRRLIFNLPLRGQRTHTNARTCKRVKTGVKRLGIKKKK